MQNDKVLAEAKRLHDMGLAIHWLHPKSKRPIESGWTTGPRKDWAYLKETYRKGLNVGVRLGTPSRLEKGFLGVLDVDVKSTDAKHAKEAAAKLKTIMNGHILPIVESGRGNGSRHYYITTEEPLAPAKAFSSPDVVKVFMPGSIGQKHSKRDAAGLSTEELEAGWRMRAAWEIGVMGEGQQVVLPPSVHPDSQKEYKWLRGFTPALNLDFDAGVLPKPDLVDKSVHKDAHTTNGVKEKPGKKALEDFRLEPVEVSWLPISDKYKAMIVTGEGVSDRSAMLLPVSAALLKAGCTKNEILNILTDAKTFLGQCSYDHAKTRDQVRAARWVWNYTLAKVFEQNSAERFFREEPPEPVKLSPDKLAYQQKRFDEFASTNWRLTLDLNKNETVRGTLRNTVLILENEIGEGMVKRDTFAYRDFYSMATPWGGQVDAALTDDDVIKIKLWIAQHFGCEPNKNIIGEALTILATRNAFDPVVDWLEALPAWDGVDRLDGWLKAHFHAKGDDEYLAQVFRKWLVAMVMRILKPGAKFDWMPIFEGAQGVGKSSFGRLLCGEKYFLDWLPDLNNKDAALALQGVWSVEMGELASFRKNEIESVKAFITRTVDKVRPPYGERWLESKRRCVFFGTTNFETYLRDDSGNRRFKPVKVGRLDFETLEDERDQLFAEALWLYRMGFETERTLEIDGTAKVYEASIQSDKMIADESALMVEELIHFIDQQKTKQDDEKFNFKRFKIRDLFGDGIGGAFYTQPFNNWKYDSRNVQFAGKALKAVNARKFKSGSSIFYEITI